MNKAIFATDPEFERLFSKLTPEEYMQLEDDILTNGCCDPILVWKNIIVDGHCRYEICLRHKISFEVKTLEFCCREEAIRWVCQNEIGKADRHAELFKYLVGKRYNTEKALTRNGPYRAVGCEGQLENCASSATELGKIYSLARMTVGKYGGIAVAVDEIAEKDSRLTELYLSGKLRIKADDLAVIAAMNEWQIRVLTNALIRQDKTSCRTHDILESLSERDRSKDRKRERERRKAATYVNKPSVKDMPTYDPDGEVASLSLTIPSWNSSIDRLITKIDLREISDKAKTQLREELLTLRDNADLALLAIEEVSDNG